VIAATRRRAPSAATIIIRLATPQGSPSRGLLWAYQFVAQLSFARESWTAPVDVERVRPAQDANVVAAEQVGSFLGRRSCKGGSAAASTPLFVFDAGYDPVKLQQGLEGRPCQILLRLRAGRRFYGDPSLSDPPEH
jgi:hypothetical protein